MPKGFSSLASSFFFPHNSPKPHNNTQTLHVCHICLQWGGFGGSMGRHIWQSHGVSGTWGLQNDFVPRHPRPASRASTELVHAPSQMDHFFV